MDDTGGRNAIWNRDPIKVMSNAEGGGVPVSRNVWTALPKDCANHA